MLMRSEKSLFILAVFLLVHVSQHIKANPEEDTWLEPDAWGREHLSLNSLYSEMGKCCKCKDDEIADNAWELVASGEGGIRPQKKPTRKVTEDAVALLYFRKMIALLFNRKKLQYDDHLHVYKRSILFTLQPDQLTKLEQLKDPRDLDAVLTEIFENVRVPYMSGDGHTKYTTEEKTGFITLTLEIFRDVWRITQISEIRFLLIVLLVIICGWLLNKRYRIGFISLIFGGLILYGYLHTYLECNRELEFNQMLEVIQRNKDTHQKPKDGVFMSIFKRLFSSSDVQEDEHTELLRKSTKISLGFCRPDHVLIMYFNDIFLKYLEVLLKQCTDTLTNLKDRLPFPYNYFAALMLICIIGYFFKLTFKYILSPRVWIGAFNTTKHRGVENFGMAAINQPTTTTGPQQALESEDRISGDNLKKLLSVMSTMPAHLANAQSKLTAASGVEEVREAIEAGQQSQDSSATSTASNTPEKLTSSPSTTNNNNSSISSSEKLISDKTQVLLEDATDEA